MAIDGYIDSVTAARLLGVSVRRVSQLADAGDIEKATRGLYDRLSIERYLVARRGSGERAWDTSTAWAAVAIMSSLSRRKVDWLSDRSTYRLEAKLREITAADLVGKTRNRANVHVFSGHSSALGLIKDEAVVRDWNVVGLADAMNDGLDGYVAATGLESLVHRYALVESASGNITLRATDFDIAVVRRLSKASDVLVALDAAGSIDARTRGAGELVLERALAWLRERRGWTH